MRILAISDSHGSTDLIVEAVRTEHPDVVLHMGDYALDASVLESISIPYRAVRGNCDRFSFDDDVIELTLENKKILMTHGHIYNVKLGYAALLNNAFCRGVDIVLFGHTHVPYCEEFDGLLAVNPGSLKYGQKTYAIFEIENGAVKCSIKSLISNQA